HVAQVGRAALRHLDAVGADIDDDGRFDRRRHVPAHARRRLAVERAEAQHETDLARPHDEHAAREPQHHRRDDDREQHEVRTDAAGHDAPDALLPFADQLLDVRLLAAAALAPRVLAAAAAPAATAAPGTAP